jgi:ABC-2 type transport system ATP-binding protein
MIVVEELTKRYGSVTAVDDLSFTVEPGCVTGFLGPNGAGKSTTMRMIVGLDRPTAGTATVDGRRYHDHDAPLQVLGAALDTNAIHGGRSARNHLLSLAQTHGIPTARVDEVLDQVGLSDVAHRRAGGFSLGMGQRLGIAAALLGDPPNLILDEPANGLDPAGIRWIRNLLKAQAAEGRSVLVSSHLLGEISLTADRLIVIGQGKLVAEMTVDELTARTGETRIVVGCQQAARLRDLLLDRGATVTTTDENRLEVSDLDAEEIAGVAAAHGLTLSTLAPQPVSLEEAYLDLTNDVVEHRATERVAP